MGGGIELQLQRVLQTAHSGLEGRVGFVLDTPASLEPREPFLPGPAGDSFAMFDGTNLDGGLDGISLLAPGVVPPGPALGLDGDDTASPGLDFPDGFFLDQLGDDTGSAVSFRPGMDQRNEEKRNLNHEDTKGTKNGKHFLVFGKSLAPSMV